jgi:Tol biopolymer transport system component
MFILFSGALLAVSCNAPFLNTEPSGSGHVTEVTLSGKIAFFSNRSGNFHLYIMNSDGSDQTQLTLDDTRSEIEGFPSWSPDGNKIAYNSLESRPDGGHQKIYVINADGSHETCLTNDSDGYSPFWSPDGNKILFLSDRDSDPAKNIFISELYLMNTDGSGQTRLTHFNGKFYGATWSPDGSKIVSVFQPGYGGAEKILVMKSDVTVADKIYSDERLLCRAPFFSPDGSQILTNFTGPILALSGMYLMNTDGSNLVRLGGGEGSWSPDGRKIVFSYGARTAPLSSQLWIMNKDRSNLVKIIDGPGTNLRPAWSR